jgi:hypothetical protein
LPVAFSGGSRLNFAPVAAPIHRPLFGNSHGGSCGDDLGFGRLDRGARGVGSRHRRVELLLRDLFLLDERLEPLDIA